MGIKNWHSSGERAFWGRPATRRSREGLGPLEKDLSTHEERNEELKLLTRVQKAKKKLRAKGAPKARKEMADIWEPSRRPRSQTWEINFQTSAPV